MTVTMLFLAALLAGAIGQQRLPLELIPAGFTPPFLFVNVPTLRATPEDVEQRVAIPIRE